MARPGGGTGTPLSRRGFLAGLATTMVVASCSSDDADGGATTTNTVPTTTLPVPDLGGDPFTLGVAAGDPLADAVVIWTRLAVDPERADGAMPTEPVPVRWEMAADESFGEVVAEGVAVAEPAFGHSVHVDVTGLPSTSVHWYRFRVGDHTSAVGRARTLPEAGSAVDGMRFAVANCQAYQTGFYTAYEHLAAEDLDLVFFVGDYIYELENSVAARPHGLGPMQTLDEFRVIYGLTKADGHLQAAHARHTWVITWDDHEVEDNYAGLQPGEIGRNLDPDAETAFPAKRAAAYQAWWEHMPVRPAPPEGGAIEIHREVAFGDLATFAVVDNRQYRDPVPEDAGAGALPRPFGGGPQHPAAFDEDRSMLGAEQEAWLLGVLGASSTPWNVLVQQSIMAEVDRRPDLDDAGFSMDAWDGYVATRDRILGFVADEGVPGFVSVGGDIHTGAVADLRADFKDPDAPLVGAELIAPSITSSEIIQPEALAGSRANPHIHYYEPDRRGYLVCGADHDELVATFRYVTTVLEETAAIEDGPVWVVTSGRPTATERR